jgi:hypothetical protein
VTPGDACLEGLPRGPSCKPARLSRMWTAIGRNPIDAAIAAQDSPAR